MSIRKASEGILKTHVTWEEFEANLAKSLNTTARFGPKKSATDLGEGIGFASRCGLIECDWQGKGAKTLPKRVVLKMGSCMALIELSDALPPEQNMFKDATPEKWTMLERGMKAIHNIECDTYDFVEQFGEGHALPKRYYAKSFDEHNKLTGQICMEYVENGRMMNFCEKASLDQLKQIARAFGKLQAASTQHEVVSDALRTKDVFGQLSKSVLRLAPLKQIEPSLVEPVEKVEEFLEQYNGATLCSTIHKQLGLTPVLVHGGEFSQLNIETYRNLRTENILLDKNTGELRAIIDWQSSHFGVGVEDLIRISFFAQSTDDRRASADLLVEEMYNAFVANLGSTPAPYSLQQLKELYDLLFPHCGIFFVTGLGVLMPSAKPQPGDSEAKRQKYAVIVDKARGVLEDIVTYHQRNKSSKHALVWDYPSA